MFKFKYFLLSALSVATFAHPQVATAQTALQGVKNIVLVHGAFADGSSYNKIIPLLEAKGYHVTAVQNPLTSLTDDVAATKRALALQDGPTLLVGHSWGGAVISEAGNDPKVAGLVFLAAWALDANQAAGDLGKGLPPTPGAAEFRPDAAGFVSMTRKGIDEDFAPDLKPAERQLIYITQGPLSLSGLGQKATAAAWKTRPSFYVVASEDRMINPELQRQLAKQLGSTTLTLKSSHVPMLSHPTEVANFIVEAAKKSAAKM